MLIAPELKHSLVDNALARFHAFLKAEPDREASARALDLEARYRSGTLRVAVVGEEKRGKSSLICALLGDAQLLPTGHEPVTACVFEIIYGEKPRTMVHFLPKDPDNPEASRPDPRDVTAEQVRDYGTASGKPDNQARVERITVEHPHPLLKAGLSFVDLPGLGGLTAAHSAVTYGYLAQADAALFVVDSVSSALTRQEMGSLEILIDAVHSVVLVQTKIDATSEVQWQSWQERNLQEIEKRLELARGDITYIPVSNTLKMAYDASGDAMDLEDSGFERLTRTLEEDLLPRKRDVLAMPLVAQVFEDMAAIAQPLEDSVAILTTQSAQKLDEMERALRKGQADFQEWRQSIWPREMTEFRKAYRDAIQNVEQRISSELDPGPHGEIVGQMIEQVERENLSANDIEDRLAHFSQTVFETCSQRLADIAAEFERDTGLAYDRVAQVVGQASLTPVLQGLRTGELPVMHGVTTNNRTFWRVLVQGRVGISTGGMLGGLATGLFFPPASLVVIGTSILGAAVGLWGSWRDGRKREQGEAVRQLRAVLGGTVQRTVNQARHEFQRGARRDEDVMIEMLTGALEQREREEREALEAIQKRRNQTQEQTRQELRALHSRLKTVQDITLVFKEAGVPIAAQRQAAA